MPACTFHNDHLMGCFPTSLSQMTLYFTENDRQQNFGQNTSFLLQLALNIRHGISLYYLMLSDDGDAFTVTSSTDGYTRKSSVAVTILPLSWEPKQIVTNSHSD